MKKFEGRLVSENIKIGIVASRFNYLLSLLKWPKAESTMR